MNHCELLNLLSAHADVLNEGGDADAIVLRHYPRLPIDALSLFALAERLKGTLVPLQARPQFKVDLRERLLQENEGLLPAGDRSSSRSLWLGAAAVGSLLPLFGLFIVWRRRHRITLVPAALCG